MKKLLLATTLTVAAIASVGTAMAADLDPPPPPVEDLRPANYDWTGLYVGGWVGSACIDGKLTDNSATPPQSYELAGCGGKGGVLAGYNHQFEDFVLGIEGDWGMTGFIAENDDTFPGGSAANFHYEFDQIATLRARAGYAFDDTLLYVTGGVAYAKGDLDGIDDIPPYHLTASHWGWTIGGGVEHAVTDNFRLRLDYLYTKLGTETYDDTCCNVDVDTGSEHEVRLAAIWSFTGFGQ